MLAGSSEMSPELETCRSQGVRKKQPAGENWGDVVSPTKLAIESLAADALTQKIMYCLSMKFFDLKKIAAPFKARFLSYLEKSNIVNKKDLGTFFCLPSRL